VADVGCGTGIATRLFAERGFDTVGIDPSGEMLACARRTGGLARYVRAEAAATGLATGSIGLVIAAQAFHWFEVGPAFEEFRRILRPDGWCAAFWNLRARTPFMDAYDHLLRTYSSEYDILVQQDAAAAAVSDTAGILDCRQAEFPNRQVLDLDGLFGRAYSHSCVRHGVENVSAFDRELTELYERHHRGDSIEFCYRTVASCWRLADRTSRQ
jgi:SAM-dependent methyltransferase